MEWRNTRTVTAGAWLLTLPPPPPPSPLLCGNTDKIIKSFFFRFLSASIAFSPGYRSPFAIQPQFWLQITEQERNWNAIDCVSAMRDGKRRMWVVLTRIEKRENHMRTAIQDKSRLSRIFVLYFWAIRWHRPRVLCIQCSQLVRLHVKYLFCFCAFFGSEKKRISTYNHRRKPPDTKATETKNCSPDSKCYFSPNCGRGCLLWKCGWWNRCMLRGDGSWCCSRQRNGRKVNIWRRLQRREEQRPRSLECFFVFTFHLWSFHLIFVGGCDPATASHQPSSCELPTNQQQQQRNNEPFAKW